MEGRRAGPRLPQPQRLHRQGVTDSREPGANGLVFDPRGRLVLGQHGDRRVARLEAEGRFATRADRYQGKRLNSPNDAVFKANGDLYFTDPPYGLRGRDEDPKKELPFNGVYRLAKDGTVTLLTREMTFPNGLAFAPDEETLYVANSDPNRALWRAFDVRDDGTLGEGRVFFDATPMAPSQKGLPDGIKPRSVVTVSSVMRVLHRMTHFRRPYRDRNEDRACDLLGQNGSDGPRRWIC